MTRNSMSVQDQINKLLREMQIMREENRNIREENKNIREENKNIRKELQFFKTRLKSFEARMYARGRSDRITQKPTRNDTGYREKVERWHNQFHSKSFTPNQIKAMKQAVGETYALRRATGKSSGKRANSYGSMSTRSLGAVRYALSRDSNRVSSHASSSKTQKSQTPKKRR